MMAFGNHMISEGPNNGSRAPQRYFSYVRVPAITMILTNPSSGRDLEVSEAVFIVPTKCEGRKERR